VCFICGTLPTGTPTVCIPNFFPPKENHNVGLLRFDDDHDHICYRFAQVQIFGGKSNVFKSLQSLQFKLSQSLAGRSLPSFNKQNCHYYAQENPLWIRETHFQRIVSVNVWCGIFGNRIIGPFFFQENLTGEIYLNFLQNILGAILENLPLAVYRGLWFQHDGTPPHYHKHFRQYLDHIYNHQWIGRGALNAWPHRSPDMTPLDFFYRVLVRSKCTRHPFTPSKSYRNA
jgi:hypothetical protein